MGMMQILPLILESSSFPCKIFLDITCSSNFFESFNSPGIDLESFYCKLPDMESHFY